MLNYQFTDLERFEKMTAEEKSMNNAFVWMSLLLDLGELTEKNAEEWAWRWAFASKLNGEYYSTIRDGKREEYIPTLEDCYRRVGLVTNVPTKTRSQFVAKIVKQFQI